MSPAHPTRPAGARPRHPRPRGGPRRALAPRPAAGGPDGERGAASAELVGTIFVVLVVGALLTTAAPGGALSGAFENTLCRAFSSFGLECGGAANPAAGSREPDEVCVVATEETRRSLGVSIAFVDVDPGGAVAVEELADGTFRVTYQGEVRGAASAGVGGGVQVTVGDQRTAAS
ncbi:hypothetical protein [Georgenia yuyongxinii]